MQKPYAMHRFIGLSAPKIIHSIPRRLTFENASSGGIDLEAIGTSITEKSLIAQSSG